MVRWVCFHSMVRVASLTMGATALRRDVGEAQKLVIGISTVMTWARCPKPVRASLYSNFVW